MTNEERQKNAEFIKEIGDSDIYSDLEFATMDFKIIEDEVEIDIQSIEEMNATFNGNSSLIDVEKQTINELVKAVKQLDKKVNSIEQK